MIFQSSSPSSKSQSAAATEYLVSGPGSGGHTPISRAQTKDGIPEI